MKPDPIRPMKFVEYRCSRIMPLSPALPDPVGNFLEQSEVKNDLYDSQIFFQTSIENGSRL